jgi:hypothetical protein
VEARWFSKGLDSRKIFKKCCKTFFKKSFLEVQIFSRFFHLFSADLTPEILDLEMPSFSSPKSSPGKVWGSARA